MSQEPKPIEKAPQEKPKIRKHTKIHLVPPQKSAQDTSNWENREFTTPSGRILIETDQNVDRDKLIAE